MNAMMVEAHFDGVASRLTCSVSTDGDSMIVMLTFYHTTLWAELLSNHGAIHDPSCQWVTSLTELYVCISVTCTHCRMC